MTGLHKIVVAGGDLVGWTVAAVLVNAVRGLPCSVTVLELPDLINVEPAQFTAASTLELFQLLGIDEDELIRRTGATFRLGTGIHYRNSPTDHRILAFGPHGAAAGIIPFHHYLNRARLAGAPVNINLFSPNASAAQRGRVCRTSDAGAESLPPLAYGLNLNTEKLTQLLKVNATMNGAIAVAQPIDSVELEPNSGYIKHLKLADGARLAADLFIDCSGESARLIGAALGVEYEDWSSYLPCSRVVALTTAANSDSTPVHHIAATDAGWISTTPLQQRAAHSLLYSPEFLDDDAAVVALRNHIGGFEPEAIATYEQRSGRRRGFWVRNCVAIGAAAGHVEALDVSTLDFAKRSALTLASLLPATPASPGTAKEFNRRLSGQLESARDFARLHYLAAAWRQTPFWQHATSTAQPESLRLRIDLFRSRGHLELEDHPAFPAESWVAALLSADIWPAGYHGLLDFMDAAKLNEHYEQMRQAMLADVSRMPEHRAYLRALRN